MHLSILDKITSTYKMFNRFMSPVQIIYMNWSVILSQNAYLI